MNLLSDSHILKFNCIKWESTCSIFKCIKCHFQNNNISLTFSFLFFSFFGLADPMYVFLFCNYLGKILFQNAHTKTELVTVCDWLKLLCLMEHWLNRALNPSFSPKRSRHSVRYERTWGRNRFWRGPVLCRALALRGVPGPQKQVFSPQSCPWVVWVRLPSWVW